MDDKKLNNKSKARGEVSDPILKKVLDKIDEAESVLVALSNDPSVDEIAAALGLSMALDDTGKHVTAIYSGNTPNALQFLKPEERFETGTESLQDFVIALNKDKADHLRYKIDGDFVKVYVTPYKTTISGDDIEFSRGDYNVDLVISLNVPAATELDAALKEHGRIMHDATSINITNGAAGKFGDVEWVDAKASSISEMVAKLAFGLGTQMDAATATALLTGLVAATDRFKNPATTPDAMVLAAKLMGAGADQQLVVQNVQGEVVFDGGDGKSVVVAGESESAEGAGADEAEPVEEEKPEDKTKFDVAHGEEEALEVAEVPESEVSDVAEEPGTDVPEAPKALDVSRGDAAQTVGDSEPELAAEVAPSEDVDPVKAAMMEAINPMGASVGGVPGGSTNEGSMAEQILSNIEKEKSSVGVMDYGKMIDEALDEPLPGEGGIQVGQEGANGPQVNTQDVDKVDVPQGNPLAGVGAMPVANQAPAVNEEEEAMSIIKAAQTEANAPLTGVEPGGELPKITPTGGSLGYEAPVGSEMNPMANNEMGQMMGGEPVGVVGSAMGPGAMPMPEQEVLPPPVLPTPDFGAMPPVGAAVPPMSMGSMASGGAGMAQQVPAMPQVVEAPQTPVMPALGNETVGMQTGVGNYQTPEQVASSMNETPSSDPSAFKIPGIHT